ncbi:MAG: PQQ-binding-like beta-propeller repeat protein [Planctomycetes bacterium]|nr:PQQ-binding-like beta-propeller repeat protein [Planctomycetota bacterium]
MSGREPDSVRMAPTVRYVLCLVLAVVTGAAGSAPIRAQQFVPGGQSATTPPAPDLNVGASPTTRELSKRFERALKLIGEENFAEASRLLQTILDSDEDVFIRSETSAEVADQSLKLKVHQLLLTWSNEGREAYERQQGAAARRLLDDAIKTHDLEAIALVARRYFHTQAGHEATYRLAADHSDHDRPLQAAIGYDRLLSIPGGASRFEPYLSIRCATSWLRTGLPDKAREVLAQLQQRHPQKTLKIGGRTLDVYADPAAALTWLAATTGDPPADSGNSPLNWTTVGGDAARNAPSSGGSPYLNRGWRSSTIEGSTNLHEHDVALTRAFDAQRQLTSGTEDEVVGPVISSMQPLVVGDLVIARSMGDIRAYDLTSGRLAWATGEKDQALHDVIQSGFGIPTPQAQPVGSSQLAAAILQRGWDDASFGTLSSDGDLVFALEDLPINPPNLDQNPLRSFQTHNRLVAYDARSGSLVWEIGGPSSAPDDPLSSSFFLGPPLVLDRRLFCLVETGGDVRVVVLIPRTGQVEWQQTLTTLTPSELSVAIARRLSGLTPSFSGDILVCPIGAEQVVGLSLSQRMLLWRYRLKQPAELIDPVDPRRRLMRQRGLNPARMSANMSGDQNRWLDSQALIADLRVIVTPRGADELYCLNLLDGSLVWKKPRGEGLFVAGVHHGKLLVVGRNFVTALKLGDGEPAWPEPARLPRPSGRGFMAGEFLHLPLLTAEVASINLLDGRVVARSRSQAGNVPGNLAAVRGTVVSQGADFVEAYRQLDALEAEIADRLAKNQDDPQALKLRGEIQLQRGKSIEAYQDLKRALELDPNDAGIRSLLVGSLLEGMRVDFDKYRKLDSEIESLVSTPQERSTHLWLKILGLTRAGDGPAALAALLKFGDPHIADQEFERIDAELSVRRDRLVRARAAELFATASPQLQQEVLRTIAGQVDTYLGQNDQAALRRLFRYFQLPLAGSPLDQLNANLPLDTDWLADEFRLAPLTRRNDSGVAAVAMGRLMQLCLSAERPRDALAAARKLATQWPDAVSLEGKTGRDLANEWLARTELTREMALESPWPNGPVEVERLEAVGPAAERHFDLTIVGDRGPYLQDTRLLLNANWRDVSARDSLGRQLWKLNLEAPFPQGRPDFNRVFPCGHLLVVSVGSELVALDVLGTADQPGPRVLWTYTFRSAGVAPSIPQRNFDINTRRRMIYNEMNEQVGALGPVTGDQVTLLSGRKLMALDALTGKPVWTREGVRPGTELFGDERYVFAISADGVQAKVYDAVDGKFLGERSLPPASKRIETIGSHMITWKIKGGRQVLARFDPWSGTDLWSRDFDDTAQVTTVATEEAVVLEISGKLTVVSLADGTVKFRAPTEPEPSLRQLYVSRSRDRYIVIANQPTESTGWQLATPQTVQVHGRVYAFDRTTGRREWMTEIHRQGWDLNQPGELPVMTFASQYTMQRGNLPSFQTMWGLTCLDKRTGKILYDNRELNQNLLFVDYQGDVDLKQLDIRSFRLGLRLHFKDAAQKE